MEGKQITTKDHMTRWRFKAENYFEVQGNQLLHVKEHRFCTTTGQPALGMLSERRPPKGFKPAYSTRMQASTPRAS